MSVAVQVKDFAVGVPGAAVARSAEHTVVVVDVALSPRERARAVLELLTDAELAEWMPTLVA